MAIVLGCVLGALILGLLVLVLLLCCRRRRRRDRTTYDVFSPQDKEIESWRRPHEPLPPMTESRNHLPADSETMVAGAAAVPDLANHPAYRNRNRENPFVPDPPPPRRTAPNSRAGLTDGTVPGQDPYLMDPRTGGPLGSNPDLMAKKSLDAGSSHRGAEALAAGVGGAAAGAALMHHHEKKEDEGRDHAADLLRGDSFSREREQMRGTIPRKPVPSNSLPMSPVSPIDDEEGLPMPLIPEKAPDHGADVLRTESEHRSSSKSCHNSLGRDLAAGGVGAALGAAATHGKDRSDTDVKGGSNAVAPGPHKDYLGDMLYGIPYNAAEQGVQPNIIDRVSQPNSRGIAEHFNSQPNLTNPTGSVPGQLARYQSVESTDLGRSSSHEPLLAAGATGLVAGAGAAAAANHNRRSSKSPSRPRRLSFHSLVVEHRPDSDYSTGSSGASGAAQPLTGREIRSMATEPVNSDDLPPTPPTRSRRNSALGTAAPVAALGSYIDRSGEHQNQSHTQEVPPIPTELAGSIPPPEPQRRSRGSFVPNNNGHNPPPLVMPDPTYPQRNDQNYRSSWAPSSTIYPHQSPAPPFAFAPRSQTPPALPSRSPRRARFSDLPYDDNRYNNSRRPSSFDLPPARRQQYIPPPSRPAPRHTPAPPPTDPLFFDNSSRGIVGDDRYPHMNLRSRRNTGDFDDVVPLRPRDQQSTSRRSSAERRRGQQQQQRQSAPSLPTNRASTSDESVGSRLASAIPGAWANTPVGAASSSSSRRPSNGNGRSSGGGADGPTLAELRRQEEARELGRRSMEGEWVGNGGYDGYEYYHSGDGMVGQAL